MCCVFCGWIGLNGFMWVGVRTGEKRGRGSNGGGGVGEATSHTFS